MKPEVKVGLLFLFSILLIAGFAFYIGVLNPFSSSKELNIAYNFAGGIEVGSPVRVMGIKVGKVKKIIFQPENKMDNGEEVKLLVKIAIANEAWSTIRKDSQFFINLAGVIGEKFIEISPGTLDAGEFQSGERVRGVDPPRIDQLISQSYGLAGKIFEFVESNESSVIDTIKMMNRLVGNLNKLLRQVEKTSSDQEFTALVKNLTTLTSDMAYFSQQLRSKEGQETVQLMRKLIWRLEPMDGPAIRKFLQEEGIKAQLF